MHALTWIVCHEDLPSQMWASVIVLHQHLVWLAVMTSAADVWHKVVKKQVAFALVEHCQTGTAESNAYSDRALTSSKRECINVQT